MFRRFVKCIELKTLDSFYTSLPPPQPNQAPSSRHKAGLARVDHNLPVQSPSQVSGSNRLQLRSALYPLHRIRWRWRFWFLGGRLYPLHACIRRAKDRSCPVIKRLNRSLLIMSVYPLSDVVWSAASACLLIQAGVLLASTDLD